MDDAKKIAEAAYTTINSQPELFAELSKLKKDLDSFFQYFLENVKKNEFLIVSYILNYCFDNAEARAKFGNKPDELGNTAYHYAAQNGCNEIILVLNDKRPFKGKLKFFLFKEYNNKSQTPLDLCCLKGHRSTFQLMWSRVGKSNHNPTGSLENACLGGNAEIVAIMLEHPKCDVSSDKLKSVCDRALMGEFGETIKNQFEIVMAQTSSTSTALSRQLN